jgi:hypothetical protein
MLDTLEVKNRRELWVCGAAAALKDVGIFGCYAAAALDAAAV